MKITNFNIGKYKKYKGIAIKFNLYFFTIKLERIGFGRLFLWRIEIQNWDK